MSFSLSLSFRLSPTLVLAALFKIADLAWARSYIYKQTNGESNPLVRNGPLFRRGASRVGPRRATLYILMCVYFESERRHVLQHFVLHFRGFRASVEISLSFLFVYMVCACVHTWSCWPFEGRLPGRSAGISQRFLEQMRLLARLG